MKQEVSPVVIVVVIIVVLVVIFAVWQTVTRHPATEGESPLVPMGNAPQGKMMPPSGAMPTSPEGSMMTPAPTPQAPGTLPGGEGAVPPAVGGQTTPEKAAPGPSNL